MTYNILVKVDENIGTTNTFEISMLNDNFECSYYTKNIKSAQKYGNKLLLTTTTNYSSGDIINFSVQVRYKNFYTLNKKNEAVYKFKFSSGVKGYKFDSAKLRWNVNSSVYENSSNEKESYNYWNLRHIGIFSKQIFVKYDASTGNFPKENSKKITLNDLLADGGYLIVIFFIVVICNVIPNDSYGKNSGFGINVNMKSLKKKKK